MALKASRTVNEILVQAPRRELQPVAKTEPGYISTIRAAIAHRKSFALASLVSFAYALTFVYASGLLYQVAGSQFPGVRELPHFEFYLNPVVYMPYIAFQPTAGWYLEMNLIQAGELVVIGGLVALNVALSAFIWRIRRNPSATQTSSWLAGVVPFFVSNGACAACAGIPAGLAFLPASLVGSLLAFMQFYGLPAILTITLMSIVVVYFLDRANELHARHESCESA